MTTTAEYIQYIAGMCPEPPSVGQIELSEKDFLVFRIHEQDQDACRALPGRGLFGVSMECLEEREAELAGDPDAFIDRHLGAPGTAFRQFEDRRAKALYEVAKRYEVSAEPYCHFGSAFGRESREVEAHFERVLQAYGRYVFESPFKQSFTLREILLIVLDALK